MQDNFPKKNLKDFFKKSSEIHAGVLPQFFLENSAKNPLKICLEIFQTFFHRSFRKCIQRFLQKLSQEFFMDSFKNFSKDSFDDFLEGLLDKVFQRLFRKFVQRFKKIFGDSLRNSFRVFQKINYKFLRKFLHGFLRKFLYGLNQKFPQVFLHGFFQNILIRYIKKYFSGRFVEIFPQNYLRESCMDCKIFPWIFFRKIEQELVQNFYSEWLSKRFSVIPTKSSTNILPDMYFFWYTRILVQFRLRTS